MRRFADLFEQLDRTTSTNARVDAMAAYFVHTPPEDAAWAMYFLVGEKLKRLVKSGNLRRWAMAEAGIAEWLFRESYATVGDLAETIALLLPEREVSERVHREVEHPLLLMEMVRNDDFLDDGELPLSHWIEQRLLVLRYLTPSEQGRRMTVWWRSLPSREKFILNKLVTGALRVGVSQTLVVRAIAQAFELDRDLVAHRLAGRFEPTPEGFRRLTVPPGETDDLALLRPYPFFLASPLAARSDEKVDVELLGERRDFLAEWKWDGIRAQLIKRSGSESHGHIAITLWSRGDEDLTTRFPEIIDAASRMPEAFVLDGELIAFKGGRTLPFGVLQRRIGRTRLSERTFREAPVAFIAYDLLELAGEDIRDKPLAKRREMLEALLRGHRGADGGIVLSEAVVGGSWETIAKRRAESRSRGVEGLMLKRLASPYRVGRVRGDWWKWKIEPLTIDAVLTYAQPGSGRRANLLTDYTFSVWMDGPDGDLVTITKAYSGLDQQEIERLDKWIRRHTLERFGPVRRVEPAQVFEIGFEAIGTSDRHKAGLALRFPRMLRWRTDKTPDDADTLAQVRELLPKVRDQGNDAGDSD